MHHLNVQYVLYIISDKKDRLYIVIFISSILQTYRRRMMCHFAKYQNDAEQEDGEGDKF